MDNFIQMVITSTRYTSLFLGCMCFHVNTNVHQSRFIWESKRQQKNVLKCTAAIKAHNLSIPDTLSVSPYRQRYWPNKQHFILSSSIHNQLRSAVLPNSTSIFFALTKKIVSKEYFNYINRMLHFEGKKDGSRLSALVWF